MLLWLEICKKKRGKECKSTRYNWCFFLSSLYANSRESRQQRLSHSFHSFQCVVSSYSPRLHTPFTDSVTEIIHKISSLWVSSKCRHVGAYSTAVRKYSFLQQLPIQLNKLKGSCSKGQTCSISDLTEASLISTNN